jgi:opacity protein-like surface antigen
MMQRNRTRAQHRRAIVSFIATLALLGASGSDAQDMGEDDSEFDTVRAGPYLGISIAGGIPTFDGNNLTTVTTPSPSDVNEEPSIGINARAGWRIVSWAAAEVQYEWMNEFKVETRGEDCANVNAQVLTGNLRLFAPHHSFHPYVLAGVGSARLERESRTIAIGDEQCMPRAGKRRKERNWEFAARFGIGFDMYLTEHVVLNLEATGVHTEDATLEHNWPFVSLTAGVQYRF